MSHTHLPSLALSAALILAIPSPARAQLDPNGFASLGTLNVSSGTLTINTDTLAMSGAATFTGVALAQTGGPQVAVFDFSSITIGSGVTVNFTGSRAIALLSRGNATVQSALSSTAFLGDYLGGSAASATGGQSSQAGQGPGGGAPFGSAAGGGGYGGAGGFLYGGGPSCGNLFQTLQGGSGGAASSSGPASSLGGDGGGAIEIAATGDLTVASINLHGFNAFSVNPGSGGGGAGGGILLSSGTNLFVTGTLTVTGGNGTTNNGSGGSGGGGGRIALAGLTSYSLNTSMFAMNLDGGSGTLSAGYAGVITVDALNTVIPNGTSATLTGGLVTSVAGSTTQTGFTIEAYIRHDLSVFGTAILGANNAFQRLDAAGNNTTNLLVVGTFDLNGFSQTVDSFNNGIQPSSVVKLAAGSTLTVGVSNATSSYVGQLTGPGTFAKTGSGVQTLSGASAQFTGPTVVAGGTLAIGNNQALQNSTVTLAGGILSFVNPTTNPVLGALAGSGNLSLAGLTSLTVGSNNGSTSYAGNLSGSVSGGLAKAGTGTWTLTGANAQSGPFNIQGGTVLMGSTGALSASAPVNVSAGATLDLNGYNYAVTSANTLTVQGNLRLGQAGVSVASGATATYNGGTVGNGFLRGPGTHVVTGAATLSGVTTSSSASVNVSGISTFQNFSNGGPFNVATNLAGPIAFDNFTNQGSGAITVGAVSKVGVTDFQTYGTLAINPATITQNFSQTTLMTNTGGTQMFFNGGSRTFVGTANTAVFPSNWPDVSLRGTPTFVAGIDLNARNAVVAGGLFVNNGYVEDSSNGFTGTSTIVADFGSLVKGAGFFQNTVQTINGGKFQAGNSPGSATFGKFVLGPGGVSSYVFSIDDAAGIAGPTPDAAGHVSGWGLVKAIGHLSGAETTPADVTWTATPADKLLISLETLVNPTTVGTDVPGLMDHFDPTRPYAWSAVEWSGNYAGPADAARLDASTAFDTGGFVNPLMGSFGWRLDPAGDTLSLTYTPSAVPEPGTLSLTAAGLFWIWRGRRWAKRRPAAA